MHAVLVVFLARSQSVRLLRGLLAASREKAICHGVRPIVRSSNKSFAGGMPSWSSGGL
jgi:hypothetical protein